MDSLNRTALELVDEAIEFADAFDVAVRELDGGATVLDVGVAAAGGLEAGLLVAQLGTGGLATVDTDLGELAGTPRLHVELSTDRPALALLGAQKAGWELAVEGFEGLGSGPARALVAAEGVYDRIEYRDTAEFAVLAVEADALPTPAVAEHVADRAGVEPSSVFLPTFRTGSVAGSLTTAARAAELAVFRLAELGYDPTDVVTATGRAPVPPATDDEEAALARTNDALAYGSRVQLTVAEDLADPDELPSSATAEYGRPFAEIFADVGWDMTALPRSVFAPAQVTVDVVGGPTHVVGERSPELVAESFGL